MNVCLHTVASSWTFLLTLCGFGNEFVLMVGWWNDSDRRKPKYITTPLIRTPVIRTANYPDRLVPSGKFVEISTKLTYLEITGYRIKYSTVLWLLELQIRRGRKV